VIRMEQANVAVAARHLVKTRSAQVAEPISMRTRAAARLFAGRFDRQICAGATAQPGRAFALHARRLTGAAQRQKLASRLSAALIAARCGCARVSPRLPLDRSAVVAAASLIGQVIARLQAPPPVDARGVARLRILIAHVGGPLYRCGHGDLSGELRAVLRLL